MSLDINLTGVEATANKSTNVNTDQASNTKYPSVKAVFDWATNLFVPTTRTVNGQTLSSDVALTASDVGAPSGSGSSTGTNTGDETQASILSKLGFYRDQINTASITVNTVVETIVGNILIPANTYNSTGGKFEFNSFVVKTSNVGQIIIKAYISQISNNIGSATQIATSGNLTVNTRYSPFKRQMNFDGTNLTGFSFTTASVSDDAVSSVVTGSLAFDETIDNYLIFTITLLSLSDNAYLQFAEFKNF